MLKSISEEFSLLSESAIELKDLAKAQGKRFNLICEIFVNLIS